MSKRVVECNNDRISCKLKYTLQILAIHIVTRAHRKCIRFYHSAVTLKVIVLHNALLFNSA